MNTRGCGEEDGCVKPPNADHNTENYQGLAYSYFTAQGFLGFNRVRPGELDVTSLTEIRNFFSLPIQFYENTEQMTANVLGLAPNADIWAYWASLYHFPGKRINLSFIFTQDQPFIIFDSAIDPEKEILFQVKRSSPSYQFPAKYELDTGSQTVDTGASADSQGGANKDISVCISNQVDQTFRITEQLFRRIKEAICNQPNDCGRASDLKKDPTFSLTISMKDYKRSDANFTSTFFVSSLYKLDGEEIVWKIDKTTAAETQAGCQLVLEQNFLIEKQLLISYNIDAPDELLVGFRLLDPSDFSKLNYYSIIMVLMLLLTVSLVVIYALMDHSLTKLLKRENLA